MIMKRNFLLILISLVLVASAILGIYMWQNNNAKNIEKMNTSLEQKVKDLQNQYASAKAAGNISTSNWKKYCDPLAQDCFSYPAQWVLQGGQPDSYPMVGATLANPSKTLGISYIDPMVKDGGTSSEHIISLNNIDVDGSQITVIEGIPVSSGTYSANFFVLSTSSVPQSAIPGKVALIFDGNPIFTVGKADSLSMSGGSETSFKSYAQAQAWFNSIDGKTLLKVFESISEQ